MNSKGTDKMYKINFAYTHTIIYKVSKFFFSIKKYINRNQLVNIVGHVYKIINITLILQLPWALNDYQIPSLNCLFVQTHILHLILMSF